MRSVMTTFNCTLEVIRLTLSCDHTLY